jgi:hypothetical protein
MKKNRFIVVLAAALICAAFCVADLGQTAYALDSTVKFPSGDNSAFGGKLSQSPSIYDLHGIYITSYTAVSPHMENLFKLIRETEINMVIIDIKVDAPVFNSQFGPKNEAKLKQTVARLKAQGVWVAGRIVVFRDHGLAKKRGDLALRDAQGKLWKDNQGVYWVDPSSIDVWDYNIGIAKKAIDCGFDEINFDYIRFPSDGKIGNIRYPIYDGTDPRAVVINRFFKHLRNELKSYKKDIILSADILGFTFVSTGDLKVGQKLADLIEYFDFVCPMVYPSHYSRGNLGLEKPVLYPYETILRTIAKGKKHFGNDFNKIRPWLQDFSIRGVKYDANMIRAQKQAVYDSGLNSWILWNDGNHYTRGALDAKK